MATRIRISCIAIACSLLLCNSTSAALVLGFSNTNYSINGINETVKVDVYLTGFTGSQIDTDGGLGTADFLIDYGSNVTARVVSDLGVTANIEFTDDPSDVFLPDSGSLANVTFYGNSGDDAVNPLPTDPNYDPDRIWLATFEFTGLSEGTTVIKLVDPDINGDNFLDFLGIDAYDGLIEFNTTASINVTAVPEPASGLVLGGMATLVYWRRRKSAIAG